MVLTCLVRSLKLCKFGLSQVVTNIETDPGLRTHRCVGQTRRLCDLGVVIEGCYVVYDLQVATARFHGCGARWGTGRRAWSCWRGSSSSSPRRSSRRACIPRSSSVHSDTPRCWCVLSFRAFISCLRLCGLGLGRVCNVCGCVFPGVCKKLNVLVRSTLQLFAVLCLA